MWSLRIMRLWDHQLILSLLLLLGLTMENLRSWSSLTLMLTLYTRQKRRNTSKETAFNLSHSTLSKLTQRIWPLRYWKRFQHSSSITLRMTKRLSHKFLKHCSKVAHLFLIHSTKFKNKVVLKKSTSVMTAKMTMSKNSKLKLNLKRRISTSFKEIILGKNVKSYLLMNVKRLIIYLIRKW